MELTWKFATPIPVEDIEKVAAENRVTLPPYLIQVIHEGNNGEPSKNIFSYGKDKEDIFKTLLSYRKTDMENVYRALRILKEEGNKLYPFGNDPGGNLICLNGEEVVLWDSETNSSSFIAKNVVAFFEGLL